MFTEVSGMCRAVCGASRCMSASQEGGRMRQVTEVPAAQGDCCREGAKAIPEIRGGNCWWVKSGKTSYRRQTQGQGVHSEEHSKKDIKHTGALACVCDQNAVCVQVRVWNSAGRSGPFGASHQFQACSDSLVHGWGARVRIDVGLDCGGKRLNSLLWFDRTKTIKPAPQHRLLNKDVRCTGIAVLSLRFCPCLFCLVL